VKLSKYCHASPKNVCNDNALYRRLLNLEGCRAALHGILSVDMVVCALVKCTQGAPSVFIADSDPSGIDTASLTRNCYANDGKYN
jgi:hypothetical protein